MFTVHRLVGGRKNRARKANLLLGFSDLAENSLKRNTFFRLLKMSMKSLIVCPLLHNREPPQIEYVKLISIFLFPVSRQSYLNPGGYSEFQVTGMIEWGQKSMPKKSLGLPTKPKKIPGPKIYPKQIPCRNSEP